MPEQVRLAGALIDVLTRQTDRNSSNVMIDAKGRVRLIDHDKSLGHQELFFVPRYSMFFHGRPLAYTSVQGSIADLPPRMRALVEYLASRSCEQLMREYHLTEPEASRLGENARRVFMRGLTQAIRRGTLLFRPPL